MTDWGNAGDRDGAGARREERKEHNKMYRHDGELFRRMWKEVEKVTGLPFEVETVSVAPEWMKESWLPEGVSSGQVISFTVTRV